MRHSCWFFYTLGHATVGRENFRNSSHTQLRALSFILNFSSISASMGTIDESMSAAERVRGSGKSTRTRANAWLLAKKARCNANLWYSQRHNLYNIQNEKKDHFEILSLNIPAEYRAGNSSCSNKPIVCIHIDIYIGANLANTHPASLSIAKILRAHHLKHFTIPWIWYGRVARERIYLFVPLHYLNLLQTRTLSLSARYYYPRPRATCATVESFREQQCRRNFCDFKIPDGECRVYLRRHAWNVSRGIYKGSGY